MIKAYIVDDEPNNISNLKFILENDCQNVEVVGEATNGMAARAFLSNHKVDVVFLDISMPGENGFEMLQAMPKKDFKVVFVTAHSEYGIQAIKASAVDYLLKPVNINDVILAIQKITDQKQIVDSHQNEVLLEHLLSSIKQSQPSTKIAVPQSGKLIFIEMDDIVSIQADGNYSIIYKKDLGKIIISKTLKECEDILNMTTFFRIHKSTIVNLHYVVEFLHIDGSAVKMCDGSQLSISRRQVDLFLDALKSKNLVYFRKEN